MIRVGVVGTSWWADAMYLPALRQHPDAEVVAVCGRDRQKAELFASRWGIPEVFSGYLSMLKDASLDALLVLSSNDSHFPITMAGLEAGLHVLCEKPLGLNYDEAQTMARLAKSQGVKHMVPFTYRFMPTNRFIKELIDAGYLGRPYHLNLRYYTGYGRRSGYNWRFDRGTAGAGAIGDIGSHFLYLARWWFGEIVGVNCQSSYLVPRPELDPQGQSYEVAEDGAIITLAFANGAHGVLHISTVAHEETPFGQTHHAELHGSEGTLYGFIDWDKIQIVRGSKPGQGMLRELPLPQHIWGNARRDSVHNTYRDIFRKQNHMTRGFIDAIRDNAECSPGFDDGAAVQRLIDAAVMSSHERRYVSVNEIVHTDPNNL